MNERLVHQFQRPKFDPDRSLIAGRRFKFAGQDYEPGDPFLLHEMTPDANDPAALERKAGQLYLQRFVEHPSDRLAAAGRQKARHVVRRKPDKTQPQAIEAEAPA